MDYLKQLIDLYESAEEMSAETVLERVLKNHPEYKSLPIEEKVRLQREFMQYVNSADEVLRYQNRSDTGLINDEGMRAIETPLNIIWPRECRIPHRKYVEAYITNISVPKSIEELQEYYLDGNDAQILVKDAKTTGITNWSAPKWAKRGDIVLFMHAKMARSHLTRLRTEVRTTYPKRSLKYSRLLHAIEEQINFHKRYGGKIYAIGRVYGNPEEEEPLPGKHYSSRIFCDVDDLYLLDTPIDISEFNSFITINALSAVTPLYGDTYEHLKELVMQKNDVPEYFVKNHSTPFPHNLVTAETWMKLGLDYRFSFILESQFRQCYVNYLLQEISGQKTLYKECACYKTAKPVTFVDNVIKINGRLLPVEVKLNTASEHNLPKQCEQYCNLNRLVLDTKKGREADMDKVIRDKVLVIDTFAVSVFNLSDRTVRTIYDLIELKTRDDIRILRDTIISEFGIAD